MSKDTQIKIIKDLTEDNLDKLESLGLDVDNYLIQLLMKRQKNKINHDDNKEKEEKEELNVDDDDKMLSLIAKIDGVYKYGLCKNGHPLLGNAPALHPKCLICKKTITSGFGSCPCTNKYGLGKAAYCKECGKRTEEEVKVKLREIELFKDFLINELQKRPEMSLDMLCFLKNRTALDRLLRDIVDSGTAAAYYTLIVLDLDKFKDINKIFGHHGADQILKIIGNIIRKAEKFKNDQWKNKRAKYPERGKNHRAGHYETIWGFRNGGDEFSIVAKETVSNSMLTSLFIDYFKHELDIEYKIFLANNGDKYKNAPNSIDASFGIAKGPNSNENGKFLFKTSDEWFIAADNALYKAKEQRNQTVIWNNYKKKNETFKILKERDSGFMSCWYK